LGSSFGHCSAGDVWRFSLIHRLARFLDLFRLYLW
jgi:hypothetical protein